MYNSFKASRQYCLFSKTPFIYIKKIKQKKKGCTEIEEDTLTHCDVFRKQNEENTRKKVKW